MNPLIVYHGDCNDGFGAAFAAYLAFNNAAEYFPGLYDGNVPEVEVRMFLFLITILKKMN